MTVTVKKITNKRLAERACEFTTGSPVNIRNMKKFYLSEHSPIRTQLYWIEMKDIYSYVSTHLVRHKFGVEHYVKSNREDRGGEEGADRYSRVDHAMLINAQALINMARKRLCYKASTDTRLLMETIVEALVGIDDDLVPSLLPDCMYRGRCHEFQPCTERRSI